MNIFEALRKPENKKSFRELVMKYHPDKQGGDEAIMKKLNDYADKGDEAFERFLNELTGKKPKKEEPKRNTEQATEKKRGDEIFPWVLGTIEDINNFVKKEERLKNPRVKETHSGHIIKIDFDKKYQISVYLKSKMPMPSIEIMLFPSAEDSPSRYSWRMARDYVDQKIVTSSKEAIRTIESIIKNSDSIKRAL